MKIAQVLYAQSWGEVTPETIEKGLGGRETAMIKLAESWAKQGHQVTNFVNADRGQRFEVEWEPYPSGVTRYVIGEPYGFHEYLPINMTKSMLGNMPWDAVVAWEMPSIFNDEDIRENARVKVCEMQVAHFPNKELRPAIDHVDYVAALSPWHAEFLRHSGLENMKGKIISLPNGVDLSRYPIDQFNNKIENYEYKNNPKFVYSSSPDRGLWHILSSWPAIRKSFQEAELLICYGLEGYVNSAKWMHTRQAQMCIELEELVQQDGVTDLGKIGQKQLAGLQMSADAWLYPLDALWPTETGCITAVENAAAGNPLIISDGDCLASEFGHFSQVSKLPFDQNDFVQKIETTIGTESLYKQMQIQGREFAETRSWDVIGAKWLDLFASDLS